MLSKIFDLIFPIEDDSTASASDRKIIDKIISNLKNDPESWSGSSQGSRCRSLKKNNIEVAITELPSCGRQYYGVYFYFDKNLLCHFSLREDAEIVRVIWSVLEREGKKFENYIDDQVTKNLK